MEICRMDKPSRYYSGTNSQPIFDAFNNFNEIDPNASSSYRCDKLQPHSSYQEYHSARSDNNWSSEIAECKQEIDLTSYTQSSNENTNYRNESGFNEPYQYPYSQISPSYATEENSTSTIGYKIARQHRTSPYQISSTKNQLPSWFHPPPPQRSFAPQPPNAYHQYPYQGNYSSTPTPPAEDSNMRNMIHLTNRYLSVFADSKFWSNDKSFQIAKKSDSTCTKWERKFLIWNQFKKWVEAILAAQPCFHESLKVFENIWKMGRTGGNGRVGVKLELVWEIRIVMDSKKQKYRGL